MVIQQAYQFRGNILIIKNIQGFVFTSKFKCFYVDNFENSINLSLLWYILDFYQDQMEWKRKSIPIEISKIRSDELIDLVLFKSHYIVIKTYMWF